MSTLSPGRWSSARRPSRGTARALAPALFVVLLATTVIESAALAQQATVQLEVDRRLVALGGVIELKVTISVEGSTSVGDYSPPAMPGFRRAGRTMQSQGMRVDPFTMRTEVNAVYTYTATAAQVGHFKLGPASVALGGQRFRSNTVGVTVRAGQDPARAAPAAPPSDVRPPRPASGATAASVFIDASVVPKTVYVGQRLVAEWRLYTQVSVGAPTILNHPQSDGFWSEELPTPRLRQLSRQMVQDRVYYSGTLLRQTLYPQRSGRLQLGELEVRLELPPSRGSFFDRSEKRTSKPVAVEVLPLPTQGQPAGFPAQNVGTFDIVATVDRNDVEVGQAAKVTLAASGTGNLRQLVLPRLPKLDALKVYEPKIIDKPPDASGEGGEKVAEYLIVPTRAGLVRIPPLVLDFFDPIRKTYRQVRSNELALRIRGQQVAGSGSGGGGVGTTNVIGPDIRPPRPAHPLVHRPPIQPVGTLQIVLLALPIVGLLLIVGLERVREKMSRPTARSRERAAARLVREQLALAAQLNEGRDSAAFYAALTAAVNGQLRHQMQQAVEGMTRAELRAEMTRAGLDATLLADTVAQLTRFEAERFAPSGAGAVHNSEVLSQTRQLVRRIAGATLRRRPRTEEGS